MDDEGDYYRRRAHPNPTGFPFHQTKEDREREAEVAALMEARWGCTLHRYGLLAPIDWYAEKNGRPWANIELKCRNAVVGDCNGRATLNMNKWHKLLDVCVRSGIPGLVVFRWLDSVRWIRLADIDARRHRMGGCVRLVKSRTDREPIIDIPIEEMRVLANLSPQAEPPPPEPLSDAWLAEPMAGNAD